MFGKPTSITRGGTSNGLNVSVTRSYVYDANQRLCKTIEPETGATVQAYDLANNVMWRASGLSLPAASCDQASVPSTRMVSFGYDALNRPTSTTYGDGSFGVSRTYTPDGLPLTIQTPITKWTLGYSALRKLTFESFTSIVGNYSIGYAFDRHGSIASMTYPGGPTLNYAPDALGRPTQIPGYVSAIVHHPNGQLASYGRSVDGGVGYSTSQNDRQLPATLRYTDINGSTISSQSYGYDRSGNVNAIVDAPLAAASRAMGYDGLDRLTAANGIGGQGQYLYDTVDNIRVSAVGNRQLSHLYDANNRLYAVSGSGATSSRSYDANGNITQLEQQSFGFDIANRLTQEWMPASNTARYHYYDGLGRRVHTERYQAGQARFTNRLYTQDGRMVMTIDNVKGATQHFYVGSKLVAEYNNQTGARWIIDDALGSPIASANASGVIASRTFYEPYGLPTARGNPYSGANPDGIGFTGHVNDVDTGLVYMQQRYYDPVAGRFLSVDPVTTDAKTANGFNRYVYGNNNPYKYKDPNGKFAVVAFIPAIVDAVVAAVASNTGAAVVGVASGVAIGSAINSSSSQGDSKGSPSPASPGGLVGVQDSKSGPQGDRHNSGPLAPENGGKGDAGKDFGQLTGGKSGPAPENGGYPKGTQVGENGVALRPGSKEGGPRIDVPAKDGKPHETLHYPKKD